MSTRSRAALAAACLLLPGVAAADAPPSATPRGPAKVYAAICGYCHGANVGPIILGRALPPELVLTLVRNGKNAMPAFRPTEKIGRAHV